MVQVMQKDSKIRVRAVSALHTNTPHQQFHLTIDILKPKNRVHSTVPFVRAPLSSRPSKAYPHDRARQELDGELEERARLLARTKASIESLQNDLARAHASEDTVRSQTRETVDAQMRRIAELERRLSQARGDRGVREDEVVTLRGQKTSLEQELDDARATVKRLEVELATAELHRSKAVEAEKTIAFQQTALKESEAAIKADAARLEVLEAEKKEQGSVIRELISTAGDLKQQRDWLEVEARELRGALEEAARRHEGAMASAEATVRQVRAAAEGKFSRELQLRLSKLHARVTELADKEQRVLQRQTAMADDLTAVRLTAVGRGGVRMHECTFDLGGNVVDSAPGINPRTYQKENAVSILSLSKTCGSLGTTPRRRSTAAAWRLSARCTSRPISSSSRFGPRRRSWRGWRKR